jgi:TolB-like protein
MAAEGTRLLSVFLSYASEDREVARRIGAALPDLGLEVWYDESELGGGDVWDQKIRRQIRECDYFMALISAQTEARREGYFRREWRLAAERTLDIADDHPFLLPVVIDDTDATHARVPEAFQSVQWTRVPGGQPNAALETLCRRLATGEAAPTTPRASLHPGGTAPRPASEPPESGEPGGREAGAAPSPATPFPVREPGQSARFYFAVLGWACRNGAALFRRLPRWIRFLLIAWAVIALMQQCHSSRHSDRTAAVATQKKLDEVASQYSGDNAKNLAKLGAMVAKQFGEVAQESGTRLLALPFAAPAGDEAASKLADSVFAQTYTRLSVEKRAHLLASDAAEPACTVSALLERGRAGKAEYVLCGGLDAAGPAQALSVVLVEIRGGTVFWHAQYPTAGADAASISRDIASHVPKLASDDD